MLRREVNVRFKPIYLPILFVCLMVSAVPVHAQKPFALEIVGSDLTAIERQEIKTLARKMLREAHQDNIQLSGLQGPFGINAFCPTGFVQQANYAFSTRAVDVTRSEGTDCDGPQQCRAWKIDAQPADLEASYSFTLQLQCSTEDSLRERNKTSETKQLRAAQ